MQGRIRAAVKRFDVFLLDGVTDGFHVGEDDASVAALQPLHERQVAADCEALDRLLLQVERRAN